MFAVISVYTLVAHGYVGIASQSVKEHNHDYLFETNH